MSTFNAPPEATSGVEKYDEEKGQPTQVTIHGLDDSDPHGTVQRHLKARHLQMIAIGGAIGTGLFIGAGGALATGGPLGIFLSYSIMGTLVGAMMIALGEMTTLYPVSGAFTHYAARFVDPALGFALGWNYWYSYGITLPTEITAAAGVISYWPRGADVNNAVWITILMVACLAFNFLGVKYYGEAEFWFSLIKVTTVIGLIILAIVITAGGGPNHDPIGFRYWKNPGPFQQENGIPGSKGRFLAFWATFIQSAFSFLGTEIVALTAGEAANPRRNVPKAIKRVFFRILLFYVLGVFMMGLIVSPNNPDLSHASGVLASPWVIGIQTAGISVLPSLINAVVLISAFSAGNSDLFAASRTLYGLACDGKAPAFFRTCTSKGLPMYCLIATACFAPLGYMTVSNGAGDVFTWLSDISSVTGLITWWSILISYIRFHRAAKRQGIDRNTFPYKAPFQPWASYYAVVMFSVIIFFNGYTVFLSNNWSTGDFIVDYLPVILFLILYVFWKFWKRTKIVALDAIDFETGRRELDAMAEAEAEKFNEPTSIGGKIWAWLM